MILNYSKWKSLYEQETQVSVGQTIDGVLYKLPKIKDINSLNAFINIPGGEDLKTAVDTIVGKGKGYNFPVGGPDKLGNKLFGSLIDLLRIHAASGKTTPYALDDNLKKAAAIFAKNGHSGINVERLSGIVDLLNNPKNKEYLNSYSTYYNNLLKTKLQG